MTITALPLLVALTIGPAPTQDQTVPVAVVQGIVEAQDHSSAVPLKALLWASAIAGTVDIARSAYEFGAHRGYEANPLLQPFQDQPEVFALVKAAVDSAVILTLWKVGKHNRRAAIMGAALYLGVRLAIVVQNYRTSVRIS